MPDRADKWIMGEPKLKSIPGGNESTNPEGEFRTVLAGTRLVIENELSRKMFILKRGKVRVSKMYMGQRVTLAVLGEGEVFGELSFFDASPRSASVDAITDVELIVIDGQQATDQIAKLPPWVVPIFRTVFHRFRQADQKITVLQSMNEFQKKVMRQDSVGKSVYLDLLRFIRTLGLLYEGSQKKNGVVKSEQLYKELDDVLGKRAIGLNVFWRVLKENGFMDSALEEKSKEVVLQMDSLQNWSAYLGQEVDRERFLMLSFSAMAVLRRVVNELFEGSAVSKGLDDSPVRLSLKKMKLEALALSGEGLEELQKSGIVELDDGLEIIVRPAYLIENFNYQNLLKSFDHTIINLD